MPNPYEYVFQHPSELLAYTALVLFLLAWTIHSTRLIYRYYISIKMNWGRWQTHPIPDPDATKEVGLLLVIIGIDVAFIGAYVYLVF